VIILKILSEDRVLPLQLLKKKGILEGMEVWRTKAYYRSRHKEASWEEKIHMRFGSGEVSMTAF
jgi:hypothetical protein